MEKSLEVNWLDYFRSIQSVCPWSLDSYLQGRIDFRPYNWQAMNYAEKYWQSEYAGILDAIVYQHAPNDTDILDDIVELMNNHTNCVYFWSHPGYTKGGRNQTLVPVIIQQDRENLEWARSTLKKT